MPKITPRDLLDSLDAASKEAEESKGSNPGSNGDDVAPEKKGLKRSNAFLMADDMDQNNHSAADHDDGNDGNVGMAAPVSPHPPNDSDEELTKSEKKRRSSRAWHAKWVKKGVPRTSNHEAPGDANNDPEPSASQPDAASVEPSPEVPPAATGPVVITNMREACAKFVKDWIAKSDLPPSNDRVLKARKAWMESDERAALIAGRQNVQMWIWYDDYMIRMLQPA